MNIGKMRVFTPRVPTRIKNETWETLSRKRVTGSLQYASTNTSVLKRHGEKFYQLLSVPVA